ncbi:hypothetical protein MROS_1335 [Melioribacter roseus P3M-2]|uniref:Outer membrane protein n=1 Tax=Melioribacter roseus (strain DSM 23840 / JCM 17771 / VKM B-2668 / P3M-2) TaxID=1191523 RepID=I6YVI7_MELRP|nr:outer membrane beta-barrel protein [Melioribacter roseus]AFN74572.1 hypothetical protein MROS_1335 [Melioribacter roseus P3M-2]
MKKVIFLLLVPYVCAFGQSYRAEANMKFHKWFRWHKGSPMLELNYGFTSPEYKKLNGEFADFGSLDIKLGYTRIDTFELNVTELSEKFLIGGKASSKLIKDEGVDYKADIWKFGFGKREGYGYRFDKAGIEPYVQEGFLWSDFKSEPLNVVSSDLIYEDIELLKRFEGRVRFGSNGEAGLKFRIGNHLTFNAAYEYNQIFPRYLFWKHAGSVAIEGAAGKLLDEFIEEAAYSSPYAAPIIHLLLKGGLSYAFYELRKDRMNWPFESESPISYATVKFSVSFSF